MIGPRIRFDDGAACEQGMACPARSARRGGVWPTLASMTPADAEWLKERVRARLTADGEGRITYASRANAVQGRVPG
jgi:hypothetical protein